MKRWAVAAFGVLALAGCGGPDDACQPAPDAAGQAVLDGANGSGVSLLAGGGYITSPDGLTWVTYRADVGDGGDPVLATWVMSSPEGEGPIMSADAYAAQWTDWPQMGGANGSDLMRRSQSCVEG